MASKTAVNSFYGTGRRKTSSARVYLRQGTGKVSVMAGLSMSSSEERPAA